MSTPSLLNIPYLYKAGTLYSQIPESGAGDFTVQRTTTVANRSTRINKDGLIELVADNVPRLDYPLGGAVNGCPALLVEPSAQNLAFHSENWVGGSNWDLSNGVTRTTGSTDAFIAPDGTFTANAISPTSGNVIHLAQSNAPTLITFTSGTIYTQSAFFKAGGTNLPVSGNAGRYVQLTFSSGRFTQLGFANFDLQNGVVAASGGTADTNRNARIENYGNGWYRCSLTATCNSSGTGVGVVTTLITTSGATRVPTFSGTVTDVLYGWGAQLEVGSVATSYIPTTTAAVTRSAEQIRNTTATALIGQSEGTIYWEGAISRIDRVIFSLAQGTSVTNFIYLQTLSNGFFRADVLANNSSTCAILSLATATLGQFYKIAFAYKENDFALYINGVLQGSDNLGALPSGLSNAIFARGDSSLITDQRCRALELYPNRIPNTAAAGVLSLATLTAP